MGRDQRRTREAEPVRITTAATNRADDIATRQRRYLLSMSIRSLCFVGAVVAALAGLDWLWPFLISGALILPYVAVVLANAATTKSDDFSLVDRGYGRPELGSAPESADPTDPTDRDGV